MNTFLLRASCLGALCLAAQSANAQLLLFGNNNGVDSFSAVNASAGANLGLAGATAAGFQTGSTAFYLDHIALSAKRGLTATGPSPRVLLYLDDGSNSPGSLVGGLTFSITGTPLTQAGVTLVADAGQTYTLLANQKYWIVLDNNGTGGTVTWTASSASGVSPTASNGSGYSYVGVRGNPADDFSGADTTPTVIPNFAVYGTAVPEPHEYALIAGLGLCGFAVYRRRNAMVKA